MRYCLYRILGSDLPPRHDKEQTRSNLMFMLSEEPEFPDCEKRFLLNRIIDVELLDVYTNFLDMRGYKWDIIPFIPDEYSSCANKVAKIHYLTNVNPARNYCIKRGFEDGFDYVMPFDGGSCFRQDGWDAFDTNCKINDGDAYFVLGQWRPTSYADFLHGQYILKETYHVDNRLITGMREFTIAFGKKHDKIFNPELLYAMADKVELIWKLGIPGIWDRWYPDLQRQAHKDMSEYAGTIKMAGWVARLPSGNIKGDQNNIVRGRQRVEGVNRLLQKANSFIMSLDKT